MTRMDAFSQGGRVFLEFLVIQNGRLNRLVFPQGDDVYATGRNDLPHLVQFILSAGSVQFRQGLPSGTGPDGNLGGPEGRLIGAEGHARRLSARTLPHCQPLGQDGLHLPQRTQSHPQLLDLVCRLAVGALDFIMWRSPVLVTGLGWWRGGEEVEYEVDDAHEIEMNDCAPSEGVLLEGDGGKMELEVFQDGGFAGLALPNFEQ